jgi:hypothetical protein
LIAPPFCARWWKIEPQIHLYLRRTDQVPFVKRVGEFKENCLGLGGAGAQQQDAGHDGSSHGATPPFFKVAVYLKLSSILVQRHMITIMFCLI